MSSANRSRASGVIPSGADRMAPVSAFWQAQRAITVSGIFCKIILKYSRVDAYSGGHESANIYIWIHIAGVPIVPTIPCVDGVDPRTIEVHIE